MARAVLDSYRTTLKFGQNRYIMRCDNLEDSYETFLQRLSDTIRMDRVANVAQLRSHLESSHSLMLLLDGIDRILDPPTSAFEEISAAIEELGSCENVCLITTSRVYPEIHGLHRVEVPILSEDGARDFFYGLCNLGRSPTLDGFIKKLDFHPLSLELFGKFVGENGWDESMLLKAWEDDHTNVVRASYHRRLWDVIEPALSSPAIEKFGSTARDVLEVIAASPRGVEECELRKELGDFGEVVDALCKFTLTYRRNEMVDKLFPVRSYFLEFAFIAAETEEVIPWGKDCIPSRACKS